MEPVGSLGKQVRQQVLLVQLPQPQQVRQPLVPVRVLVQVLQQVHLLVRQLLCKGKYESFI